MKLSRSEMEIFKQYQIGVTKKEFDGEVLKLLLHKKLIHFNMNFLVLTKQGKKIWDSLRNKNNDLL